MKLNYTWSKRIFIIFLVLVFAAFYFVCSGSDKAFHFERVYALSQELRIQGLLAYPYYISSHTNFGMGYATPLFYPDIFVLPPAILVACGASLPLVMALWNGMIYGLSFVSMRYSLRRLGYSSTYVPAVCYICSSFIVFESIDRGSQGSNMIFLFAPLVFSSTILICHGKELGKNTLLLAVSMAGCILSHVLSSVILTIGLIIYLIFDVGNLIQHSFSRKILCYASAAFGSLGLSAWFLMPMCEQLLSSKFYVNSETVTVGKFALSETVLLPIHLFFRNDIAAAIYGRLHLTPKYASQLSWTIPSNFWGNISILCIVFIILIKKYGKHRRLGLVFCAEGALCIIFSFSPILTGISSLSVFQFVWRIMLLLPISVCFALAAYLNSDETHCARIRNISLIISLICIIGYYIQLALPLDSIPSFRYEDGELSSYVMQGEYLPEAFPDIFYGYDNDDAFPGVTYISYDNDGYHFALEEAALDENSGVQLPVTWYLGYTAYDSAGNEISISESSNGTVQLDDISSSDVTVKYTGTTSQKVSRVVSAAALIVLLIICCLQPRYHNRRRSHHDIGIAR